MKIECFMERLSSETHFEALVHEMEIKYNLCNSGNDNLDTILCITVSYLYLSYSPEPRTMLY